MSLPSSLPHDRLTSFDHLRATNEDRVRENGVHSLEKGPAALAVKVINLYLFHIAKIDDREVRILAYLYPSRSIQIALMVIGRGADIGP